MRPRVVVTGERTWETTGKPPRRARSLAWAAQPSLSMWRAGAIPRIAPRNWAAVSPYPDRRETVRAILSVYDKTGIEAFARGLVGLGWELISTGNTQRAIAAAGIP